MPKNPMPIPANGTQTAINIGSNKENDSIPTYLYFIKAMQEGNHEAANQAIKHAMDTHGTQMGTDLAFLAKRMQGTNINDIARRSVMSETNPELRRLYSTINENPDVVNKFQYYMPDAVAQPDKSQLFRQLFSKK